ANTATGATRAFLRRRDGMTVNLGTLPGGTRSTAFAINDLSAFGQVVGSSDMTGGQTHAFGWSATLGMFDLGTLGGTFSTAVGVNTAGQIVGSTTNQAGMRHAFRRTGFRRIMAFNDDLGTLGGLTSDGFGINAAGQVVGSSTTAGGQTHAFRWTSG